LGGGAPVYEREYKTPAYFEKIAKFDASSVSVPADLKTVAQKIAVLPNIASKRWVYTQYDSMVGTGNSSTNDPSDAAVVLVKESGKALAVTTDCNSRYVHADPYKGAMIAVSEAARNIVCSGGTPLGVTNCLNFGNPYDPEVYYQFVHAIKGMGEACLKFDTPVTGGNVSFYNQNPDGAVYPTPTIGMVGVLEHVVIGNINDDINCSEYLHKIVGVELSPAPRFELNEEYTLQQALARLIHEKLIVSAHDISEGGLFIALLESGFAGNIGFEVAQKDENIRSDAYWFGESQSRAVVSVKAEHQSKMEEVLQTSGVPFSFIGKVSGSAVIINRENWGELNSWRKGYDDAIGEHMH
jgi:phosphoribosylformylglycinamidine (FGAM) synthase-like enzyme